MVQVFEIWNWEIFWRIDNFPLMMLIFFKVLDTMVGWVQHFFGCRGKKNIHKQIVPSVKFDWKEFSHVVDCKDHFLNDTENGDAIKREVMNKNSSILWYVLHSFTNTIYTTST